MEECSVKNPQSQAGFLSLLTFSWITGILKLGTKQPLGEKDLFAIDTSYQSERLVDDLESEWLAEERASEQNRTRPRLWRAMMRVIPHRDYITLAIHRLIYSLTLNGTPLLVYFFLRSIAEDSEKSYVAALPFVLCFALVPTVRSICNSQWVFKSQMVALRLKVAMIGFVYKRILSMNRRTLEEVSSGNIVNVVSNDAKVIEEVGLHFGFLSFALLDIAIAVTSIWKVVAWQALAGTFVFWVVFVYGSLTARKAAQWRRKAADQIDKRLEIMKEIISGIRAVKMYAWEWNFKNLVTKIRRKELSFIRRRGFIVSSIYALFFTSTNLAGLVSVLGLVFSGITLKPIQVFTLLSILSNIRLFVTLSMGESSRYIMDAKTALKRVQILIESNSLTRSSENNNENRFPLQVYCRGRKYKPHPVRIESFRSDKPTLIGARRFCDTPQKTQSRVLLSKASCHWNQACDHPALNNVSLEVNSANLVGITGRVGSGKTSLLMAILGELPVSSGQLSCTGKIAYVSQMPWVFSGTLRENILFGRNFDEQKYQMIIQVCDLETDINCFPKGDLTEIGQCGVILSGGQRARVSLARAVYSDADIYLLDDPLSAVDAKVGKLLFENCIKGFLGDRIRILATHQVQFLKQTDYFLVLESGSVARECKNPAVGREKKAASMIQVESQQKGRDANKYAPSPKRKEFEEERNESFSVAEKQVERLDLKEEKEDRMVGSVEWWRYWKYFRTGLPVVLVFGLFVFFVIVQVTLILPYWWLSRMTDMPYEQQRSHITLLVYASMVTMSLLLTAASSFCFYLAAINASENLHDEMTEAVIKAPVLFFDTNPVGRILNRFSKDTGCMDDLLPGQSLFTVQLLFFVFSGTILSAVSNIWLSIVCIPLTLLFIFLAKFYLRSSREMRRVEALTCSPMYSCIADTVAGLEIIRSSAMEVAFISRLYRYLDKNTAALIMLEASTRWLAVRGDAMMNFLMISISAGALLVTQSPVKKANKRVLADCHGTESNARLFESGLYKFINGIILALAGIALSFAVQILDVAQYAIRMASNTENHMTSVERVMTYASIEPEPGYRCETVPPEQWPSEGGLNLTSLSLKYLKDAPKVLSNISFSVAPKEKVGVAGRTGAGKSSLVAALFRMPEPEGLVIVDGVNLKDLNLQASRRSMAVITQDPVLFSGSLRRNLDPFSLHDDQDIWRALEEVQLKTAVQQLPGQLEYRLRESGSNFSVGERQLVCLARALLQKSKIIILDEATANVDYKTDRLIQDVIRSRFKDTTVLTIAHRLNTIMDYDKVLFLDQGQVVEFDKTEVLLQNDNGYYAQLVQTHRATADQ